MSKPDYICRCEEVTRDEVLQSICEGAISLDAVKKETRAGLGYCQGKSCKRLVAQIISGETGVPVDKLLPGSIRYPAGPVCLSVIADTQWEIGQSED